MPAVTNSYNPTCQTQFDSDKLLYSINVDWSTSSIDCGFTAAIDYFSVLLYEESQTGSDNASSSHELLHAGEQEVSFDMVTICKHYVQDFAIHVYLMRKLKL